MGEIYHGKYKKTKQIGIGGQAKVFLCEDITNKNQK